MKPLQAVRRSLLPLVPAYRLALAVRELRLRSGIEAVRRLRYPVISIGNLSTGGTGKTPFTIALAGALTRRGVPVDVLSRGYGRQSRLPARVREDGTAAEFGDEPLLIARESGAAVYVAPHRYDAGLLAEQDEKAGPGFSPYVDIAKSDGALQGAEKLDTEGGGGFNPGIKQTESMPALAAERRCSPISPETEPSSATCLEAPARIPGGEQTPTLLHLLDDGFQHRQLHRDIDILLLNLEDWHDTLLPAGNLREPHRAARRASIIAIPFEEPELEVELRSWGWQGPIWRLHRCMQVPPVAGPVAAFCGIARPGQFFAGLAAAGLHIATRTAFADHHRYVQHDIDCLIAAARAVGAIALITTEKDETRLGDFTSSFPPSLPLKTARLCIEIHDEEAALQGLMGRLQSISPQPPL